MKDLQKLDIIWTDVETTGLNVNKDQIVEIGWVVTDWTCQEVKEEGSALLDPEDLLYSNTYCKPAFQVNGYLDRIKKAGVVTCSYGQLLYKWRMAAEGNRIGGANVGSFDFTILKNELLRVLHHHIETGLGDYHVIDVCSVAAPLLLTGEIAKLSSSSELAKWTGLGVEPKPHTALYGARQALSIYQKLLDRFIR